jgi:DNA-directed RNA polymerase beta subunit
MKKKDVWACNSCKDNPEVSKIAIPYAFKLFVQELMAINILPRIKVKQEFDN